jgi:repressor LexA
LKSKTISKYENEAKSEARSEAKSGSKPESKPTFKLEPKHENKKDKKNPVKPLSLTPREVKILQFLEKEILTEGISPSFSEIQKHFDFSSINSVQNYIKQLKKKGYVDTDPFQKRSLRLLQNSRFYSQKTLNLNPRVPLLGKVAAGQPIERFEFDESIEVPAFIAQHPEDSYALKVVGDSMIGDGLFEGDILIVQKANQIKNGEIVIATIDEESTVKRYYLRKKDPQGPLLIELRPANSQYQSLWYSPEKVKVQGLVKGLMRTFQ